MQKELQKNSQEYKAPRFKTSQEGSQLIDHPLWGEIVTPFELDSSVLFLEFEEVRRLLLVGHGSSSELTQIRKVFLWFSWSHVQLCFQLLSCCIAGLASVAATA
ncbi:hypothetical protein Tco_0017617 [Tanacetum coccineum]